MMRLTFVSTLVLWSLAALYFYAMFHAWTTARHGRPYPWFALVIPFALLFVFWPVVAIPDLLRAGRMEGEKLHEAKEKRQRRTSEQFQAVLAATKQPGAPPPIC